MKGGRQPLSGYIANLPGDTDRIGFLPVLVDADESGITNDLAHDAPWHMDVLTGSGHLPTFRRVSNAVANAAIGPLWPLLAMPVKSVGKAES